MKSSLLVVVVVFCTSFFTFSSTTKTWIALEKANRTNIKRYEKHCLGTIYNIGPMDKGEVKRIEGTCVLATCMDDRNIRFSGCPAVVLSDRSDCRVYQGNLTKEYPECCYEIRCDATTRTVQTYDGYVNITATDIKRKTKEAENNKN